MDGNRTVVSKTSEETSRLGGQTARSLVELWKNNQHVPEADRIYCLYGELGSGKTTFVQGFAQELGISSRMLSPTFLIVRQHLTPFISKVLYHLDLYRIQDAGALAGLGLGDILADSQSCVMIEWAEKMGNALPQSRTDIYFTSMENGFHTIQSIRR